MLIIATPFVICIVGLLMYALASNPKVVRIGEIMFFCGLLVALMAVGDAKGMLKL